MVRSAGFAFNNQTGTTNYFQKDSSDLNVNSALKEFDAMVTGLQHEGSELMIFEDKDKNRPDSIFPNNWIASIPSGPLCIFPMMAENRRTEVRNEIIESVADGLGKTKVLDVRVMAGRGQYLEGTGSIVFHHASKTAFACVSPRTHPGLLREFCREIGYRDISFGAYDAKGNEIYHTNVMLSVADTYAILCEDAVTDALELSMLKRELLLRRLEIISIQLEQMNSFCANVLQIQTRTGKKLAMSETARKAFSEEQWAQINKHNPVLVFDAEQIEKTGGGGVRCMMAMLSR